MIKVNRKILEMETFPNGEKKVPTFERKMLNDVEMKWESDEDFITLMFVKDALDEMSLPNMISTLKIPFLPYGRMDRKIEGSLFTLKSICKFINSLGFTVVETMDNHSEVSNALIDNLLNHNRMNIDIQNLMEEETIDCLFYPDAGAEKRYDLDFDLEVLIGEKERDLQTGRIKTYNIRGFSSEPMHRPLEGKTVLIIDDLCSYGGTFVLAADKLKDLGAKKIILMVTHCEKSILDGKIFNDSYIDIVYTTNSLIYDSHASDRLIIENVFF